MPKETSKKIITEHDVQYVAELARLRLDNAETEMFQKQLSTILGYIDQLNEVNTKDVPPMTHVAASVRNVFREDEVSESISPDEALRNAPEREKNFFKVPKVIKEA